MHKLLLNPVYCKYNIEGSLSAFEDEAISAIRFNLLMDMKDEGIVEIGAMLVLRIPCHRNIKGLSTRYLAKGYDMGAAMEGDDDLSIVADELGLSGEFAFEGFRKTLQQNDLYYIQSFYIKPEYRGEGAGFNVMKQLVKWIQSVTGDIQPVITALPYPTDTDSEYQSIAWNTEVSCLKHFLNELGYRSVAEGAETMAYVPYPKGLYQEVE